MEQLALESSGMDVAARVKQLYNVMQSVEVRFLNRVLFLHTAIMAGVCRREPM